MNPALYSYISKDNKGCVFVIEYVLTDLKLMNKRLAFKTSSFTDLASSHHIIALTDLGEIVIETDNPFLISTNQIEDSLPEGMITNVESLEAFLRGENRILPHSKAQEDEFTLSFIDNEKKIIDNIFPEKCEFCSSFKEENLGNRYVIPITNHYDTFIESHYAAAIAPGLLGKLAKTLNSSIDLADDIPLSKPNCEYGDCYTISIQDDDHVLIKIDSEYQGRLASLSIKDCAVFSGFLWECFDLGALIKEKDLKSLNRVIKLIIED